ncbi:MAG TPA: acyl-CoA dehydrogenase family protein [Acidimicrobiales bacterium]
MAIDSLPSDLSEYRLGLRVWLEEHRGELEPETPPVTHEETLFAGIGVSGAMWQAGWKRAGWPEIVGGLGGGDTYRATYYDEISRAGFELPDTDFSLEVIGPALIHFAPHLAEAYFSRYLAGEEIWGQGFSEPDAGSDLASLRTKGVIEGDEIVVDGQKVWTSHGQFAKRFLTLVRTGTTESRHRGISALLIDAATPGIETNALVFASGIEEMSESFYDGARVPIDRMIGGEGDGWKVAMHMLQYERSMYAAQRQALLSLRLRQMTEALEYYGVDDTAANAIGAAWLYIQQVRARAIVSVRRLEAGDTLGPEASADKILLARAEQALYEVARHMPRSAFVFADGAEKWRQTWWYSRATSIFGGAGEIQRSIVADRVLQLPSETVG